MTSETTVQWQQLLSSAKDAYNSGNIDESERVLNLALMQAHQNDAPEGAVAEIFFHMGMCAHYRHDFENAEKRYKQALRTAERSFGADSSHALSVKKQLAALYQQTNQPDKLNQLGISNDLGAAAQQPTAAPFTSLVENQAGEQVSITPVASKKNGDAAEKGESVARAVTELPKSLRQTKIELSPGQSAAGLKVIEKPPATMHPHSSSLSRTSDYQKRLAESVTQNLPDNIDVESLVHPREKSYATLCTVISCMFYLGMALSLIGLVIAPILYLFTYLLSCVHHGQLRSQGIRISPDQFPEVYEAAEDLCARMGMPVPEMFIIQEHGLLNAYAKRAHHRDMVVIYSNVFEMAYESGLSEMNFILAHELTHVKRKHVKLAWLRTPAHFIPFLGHAYSRACEYTCDRVAAQLVPDGALYGLVALASGTHLYQHVNLEALYEQQSKDWDFWTWYAEVLSTHPNLVNRISAIGLRNGSFSEHASQGQHGTQIQFPRRHK